MNTETSHPDTDDLEFHSYFTKMAIITGIMPLTFFILFLIGADKSRTENTERAHKLAETSIYHAIAVESYLDCRSGVFSSRQECAVTAILLAQQSGLVDSSQLAEDMRGIATPSNLSLWQYTKLGFNTLLGK